MSICDRLRERLAPLGYEDSQGFHYGTPPRPSLTRRDTTADFIAGLPVRDGREDHRSHDFGDRA